LLTKKLTVIVLVALALSTTLVVFNQTFAQTTDPQKQKAQTLLEILEENNMTILSAFTEIEQKNISLPDGAQNLYEQGLVYSTEAQSLLQQENFPEASAQAVLAMQTFEESLRLLESVLPLDSIPSVVETAFNLKAKIIHVANYVERLESMAQKASVAGYNTLGVEKHLTEITSYLENATQKLHVLDLEAATLDLDVAETLLDELMENVSRLTKLVSESNVQRYLKAATDRLSVARADISVSATLTPKEKDDALTALNNSEASLSNARNLIEDSNVDDAIEKLEEAKRWEAESTAALSAVAVTPSTVNTNESLTSIKANTAD
jgi:tetratricopeptide (TPR) repeat protein